MNGATAAKSELWSLLCTGDTGNKFPGEAGDKGTEGTKAYRCMYGVSSASIDVMAVTADREEFPSQTRDTGTSQ